MKKQYAYIQSVENSGKRTSAGSQYFQVVTEDSSVFFFTESDMKKAKSRAEKNTEDQKLCNVTFVDLDKKDTRKSVTLGEALGKLLIPWKW